MVKKKNKLEKIAKRLYNLTHAGLRSSCSNCEYNLGPNYFKSYKTCPGCDYTIREGKTSFNP